MLVRKLYIAHVERTVQAISKCLTTTIEQQRFMSGAQAQVGPARPDPRHSTPGAWPAPVKEDLLDRFLGNGVMARSELLQRRLQEVSREFRTHEGDTGSSQVQVARLTERIKWLGQHMASNRKDFSSRRGLERCLNQRRKLLQYMRRTEFNAYMQLLPRLGLKDVFVKMDRLTLAATARHILHGPVRAQKKSKSR
eukprot:jgi/Botrbrau1/17656/Bobra.0166s0084.1